MNNNNKNNYNNLKGHPFHTAVGHYCKFVVCCFFLDLASLELEIKLEERLMSLSKQESWKSLKRYF